MTQLELNLEFPIKLGEPLYPQPPKYTACIENPLSIGNFGFFDGNEMEGHFRVATSVTDNPDLMPKLVNNVWIWSEIDGDLKRYREYYKKP